MNTTLATETQVAETHCPYCALQCAMTLTPTSPPSSARLPLTITPRDFPTNWGGLCRKGWTAAEVLVTPGRVTQPMVRRDGVLVPATWAEALGYVAGQIRRIQAESGQDAIGVFGGGGLTNEKAYLLGKFARVALRTSRIDYNGRFCMSSAAAAANRAFGVDRGLPFPVTDLDTAATVLLLGTNPADTMPPFVQHLAGARASGGLIVVDPRVSATAELTHEQGGLHLAPTPGTDLALILGISYVVVHEKLTRDDYLAQRTAGSESVIASLSSWWPERTAQVTGVPAIDIRKAARLLAAGRNNGGSYIITGRGVEQHIDGTDTVTAAINLALLLGLPGTPGNGYGTLTGQGNGQGGREHGQKSDQLPGYRKITDPAARAHVAKIWNIKESDLPGPGVPAVQLLASLGPDGVRGLLVHGSNPVVSAPDGRSVRARLTSLDLLVVCDFVMSETAELADVVLPVTQWAEESGTMTTLEGRIVRRRQSIQPPPEVRNELWIMTELARLLGVDHGFSADPAVVFDELRRASAGGLADYSGLDDAALDGESPCYWPYPTGSAGTPRLFADSFSTTTGLATMVPVRPQNIRETVNGTERINLITGRLLGHYQSGAQTRRVPELNTTDPHARLQMHPHTAAGLGLADDDAVIVVSDRGEVRVRLLLTRGIRRDTAFLPFHFPSDESANVLTNAATDPISGMPEFKFATATVRKEAG